MLNRLTFLEEAGRKNGSILIKYQCRCGNITICRKSSYNKSCGHCNILNKYYREYNSYSSMLTRIYNKNHKEYKYYGGIGITVCQSWRDDFFNFLEDMGIRPKGTTLDRKNNKGDYNKENCRWATAKEQANNR